MPRLRARGVKGQEGGDQQDHCAGDEGAAVAAGIEQHAADGRAQGNGELNDRHHQAAACLGVVRHGVVSENGKNRTFIRLRP